MLRLGVASRAEIARRHGLPEGKIRLENDANAAVIGQHGLGAIRTVRELLVVTLGTGAGGRLVLDGKL